MRNINNRYTGYSKVLKLAFIILLLPLVFVGCSSGGSGDNNIDSQGGATVNATYSKGPVTGATATLRDADNNIVAGPITTVNGSASFESVSYNGPVYAVFSGGSYTDEATGTLVTLDSSLVIRSGVIINSASGSLNVVATPLTEIAFQRAEAGAVGSLDLSTVNSFIQTVADEYGLEAINLTEVSPTPMTDITGTSDSDRYGAVLAAITQQQLLAGNIPNSESLASYMSDNVNGLDENTFSVAINALLTNTNTSAFISGNMASTLVAAVGESVNVDTTAPTLSLLSATPAETSANFQFNSDEAGTAYFIAQAGGSEPTALQVKNGSGNSGRVDEAGSITAILDANNASLADLMEATAYTLYVTVEDAAGNLSSVVSTSVTTTVAVDTSAPILSSLSVTPDVTTASLQFTSNEAGSAYYLVQAGGSVPTASQVKSGSGNGGTVYGAASLAATNGNLNNANLTGLEEDSSYLLYLMVEDAAGNQSSVVSVAVITLPVSDITAPIIDIYTNTYTITGTTMAFTFYSNEIGVSYYLVQEGGNSPSVGQLKSAVGNGGIVPDSGSLVTSVGSNIINLSGLNESTSYTVYLVTEDAAANPSTIESEAFTTLDTTAPLLSGVNVSATVFSAELQFNSDESGTIFYLAQNGGSAPSASQVKNGSGGGGVVVGIGNKPASVGFNTSNIIELAANTAYTLYFLVEDAAGNQSAVGTAQVMTLVDDVAPILSGVSASSLDTTANFQFTSDEAGTGYYLAQQGGSTPSQTQVKNGSGNGGVVAGAGNSVANFGANTAAMSGLSLLTSYTLYLVVEDASANISTVYSSVITTSDDVTAPVALITFPPAVSMIEAESSITIQGTTSDINVVTSVQVNGFDVTTSDDYKTWTISMPLVSGSNNFQVSTSDSLANTDNNAAEAVIESVPISLVDPVAMVLDRTNNRTLVLDRSLRALVAVDLTTGSTLGDKSIVSSGAVRGNGDPFVSPQGLDIDESTSHAYVVESAAIIDVDLTTGNRTILSNASHGTGQALSICRDLTIDTVNNRLFVLTYNSIIEVDITTGNRSLLVTGLYSSFIRPTGILYTNNTLYLSNLSGQDGLIQRVNLSNGSLTTVSTNNAGFGLSMPNVANMTDYFGNLIVAQELLEVNTATGNRESFIHSSFPATRAITWGTPVDVTADTSNDRFLVVDSTLDAVVAVEHDNLFQNGRGAQTMISGNGVGSGTFLKGPSSVVVDSKNKQLIIADVGSYGLINDKLYHVDLSTSERVQLSGEGPYFTQIKDLSLDSANNRVFVLEDYRNRAIFSVDLTTGDRTLITNSEERDDVPKKGTGTSFSTTGGYPKATSLVLDSDNNRVLVSALQFKTIIAVDLTTGNRSDFSKSSSSIGSGLEVQPSHMIIDTANNRVVGVDRTLNAVVAIDLTSGDRSIISDATTGSGDDFTYLRKISLDSSNSRFLVLDSVGIVAVDVSTGNRTTVSDELTGAGVSLLSPVSLALDPASNLLYVGDSTRDAIMAIQTGTGDRVIMAK